jgi:predicted exporter
MSNDAGGGQSRGRWLAILIGLGVLISAAGWLRLRVDNSLEPLLPENSDARQTILFLRDSSFADKAVLWFRLRDPGAPVADLFVAEDATEKRLDRRLIRQVIHPPEEAGIMDEAMTLLDDAGQLLDQNDLKDVEAMTSPAALQKRMRAFYLQLVEPQSSFTSAIARRDPLGVSARILSRLLVLKNGLGYRVEVKDGRFMHPDGRESLMILETSATATSLQSSKDLANHFAELAAAAPADVEIIPICPQIHTEQNDAIMERDMRVAGAINTVAFLLLFLVVSRDFRVGAVFLLPLLTTAMTIGWCALFYPHLSTMMIGLAVTMAGSAVDYGIFVYTAVTLGRNFQMDIRKVRRPLVISHLTTLGVFVAFLFSKIPAYRQLGMLTSISLFISLLAALFVLPKIIRPGGKLTFLGRGVPLRRWGKWMQVPNLICVLLLVGAVILSLRIRLDPDITRLDAVGETVRKNEKDFQKTWGQSDTEQALLVVSGPTRAAAEEANDEVTALVAPVFPSGDFASLSTFWPSAATRQENLRRWEAFWTPGRIAELKKNLCAAGEPYGFSDEAFAPFFANLAHPPSSETPGQIVQMLSDRFVSQANGQWQMLNYFADSPQNIANVKKAIAGRGDVQIVSRTILAQAFAESAASETKVLVGISSGFIVVSLLVLTRSVRQSIIIMLPAAVGLAVMLAALVIAGQGMSVVSVVASILVLALGSDYGVFAAYAWDGGEAVLGQGMSSVLLSFLTTLAGTGAMLLARHPGLWLVGVCLTSGLLAAFVTALVMIPAIEYLREVRKERVAA